MTHTSSQRSGVGDEQRQLMFRSHLSREEYNELRPYLNFLISDEALLEYESAVGVELTRVLNQILTTTFAAAFCRKRLGE